MSQAPDDVFLGRLQVAHGKDVPTMPDGLDPLRATLEQGLADLTRPVDDPLARYVALETERREVEVRLDEIKAEAAKLQERILEDWAGRGMSSAKINGLLVFTAVDFWCSKRSGIDTAEVCRRLEAAGLGRLVAPAYSAQSLKAWVKEQSIEDEAGNQTYAVPDELLEVIQFGETARLRTRKG